MTICPAAAPAEHTHVAFTEREYSMQRMRIAIATAPLGLPIRQAIDAVTSSGVQGVQLDLRHEINPQELGSTGRRQLLHYLEERQLKVGPVSFALRRPIADPEALDARLDAIRTAMGFAWELGARTITLQLGQLPDKDDVAANDLLSQVLCDLASHANRVGVVPALITSGDSAKKILAVLQSITVGPLTVEADPAALVLARQSPAEWLRELHNQVGHIQLRDAIRDVGGLGKEVAIGRGEVDWDEFAAMLEEMEYQHWLTVARTSGNSPLEDSLRGVQFVRNLLLQG